MTHTSLARLKGIYNLSRIGINADTLGYLCEAWAEDIGFMSERAKSPDAAIRKLLRSVGRFRRSLGKPA